MSTMRITAAAPSFQAKTWRFRGSKPLARRKLRITAGNAAVPDLKREIVRSVSNTNRGKVATGAQKQKILSLVQKLETLNSVEKPVDSDLLSGTWALLYTAPANEITANKYAGTEEGPFLSRIKPLALGTVKQTRSLQVIDTAIGSVQNLAEFSFFGFKGSLCIFARAVKDTSPEKAGIRLQVTFERFELTLNCRVVASISLGLIEPRGWVDTTYLDEDLRIGRGDKGSIFVAVRTKLVPQVSQ